MKLAIITGGSRGLGAALAQNYRDDGWYVIECSRSGETEGSVRLDLSRPADASATLARCFAELRGTRIEEIVAINNAAQLGPVGPLATKPDDEILRHVDVNVAGGIVFMTSVLRAFSDNPCPKTLVNISSGAAQRPFFGWSLYCASKAGLERFIECVALEQDALPHPFVMLNISPGVIDTGMQDEIRETADEEFPDRPRFVELQHEGALKPADTVAGAISRIVASRPESGQRIEVADWLS